jgi:hypothetical protein
MPAGNDKPPDPTMFLTKFKISFPIVAVPPPTAPHCQAPKEQQHCSEVASNEHSYRRMLQRQRLTMLSHHPHRQLVVVRIQSLDVGGWDCLPPPSDRTTRTAAAAAPMGHTQRVHEHWIEVSPNAHTGQTAYRTKEWIPLCVCVSPCV